MDMITEYGTKAYERRRKLHEGIQTFLEDVENRNIIDEEEKSVNGEISYLESLNNYHDALEGLTSKRKGMLRESNRIETTKKDLMTDMFKHIVMESLVIDKEPKEHNRGYIEEQSKAIWESMLENGIKITESIMYDIQDKVHLIVTNSKGSEDYKELLEMTKEACDFELSVITEAIKNKVIEAVRIEKVVATQRQQLLESEQSGIVTKDRSKTLFRMLQEKNINYVMDEVTDLTPEEIHQTAMAESLIDYTILESLHTLNLLPVDPSLVRDVAKFK